MTRKDTILVAVVINAGLLAVLFATAIIYDTDQLVVSDHAGLEHPLPTYDPLASAEPIATGKPLESLDYVPSPLAIQSPPELFFQETPPLEPIFVQGEEFDSDPMLPPQKGRIDITVKRGDVLEKIARAHGTTVAAIKKANQLQSEKLSIGQVLKIPEKAEEKPVSEKSQGVTEKTDAVYYVLKEGDSPWKVAKQHKVKFEDLLRLNHLDEEKARKLKIGDRIRVK